jgi:hypothetical protein
MRSTRNGTIITKCNRILHYSSTALLHLLPMRVEAFPHLGPNTSQHKGKWKGSPPYTVDYPHIDNHHNHIRPSKLHVSGSAPISPITMDKIWKETTDLFRDMLGISMTISGLSYRKPYNHWFDTTTYPQGAMILDVSNFFGEGGKSTHGHICQFLAQVEELADREAFHVRLFSLSLIGTTFVWYAALPPNSISS